LIEDLLALKAQLDELEIFYIDYFDTFNNGYNLTTGGEGSLGRVTTEETKRKISEGNKGKRAVNDIKCICDVCGQEFSIQPWLYRLRIKRSKSGKMFCSNGCTIRLTKKLPKL